MTWYALAVVTLKAADGLPEDDSDMDFAFSGSGSLDSTAAGNIDTSCVSFLQTVQTIPGTDHALAEFIGSAWASNASDNVEVNVYDLAGHLDGSAHGSPVFTYTHAVDHPDDYGSMPSEVGLCASFRGSYSGVPEISGVTRPRARRRGRVFVPWLIQENASSAPTGGGSTTWVGGQARPGTGLIDTLRAAIATITGEGVKVWSRADAAMYDVVETWVDNAYDTQRRRGPKATTRYTGTA